MVLVDHEHTTGLLEAGVDLLTIGHLLGHKSFSTTMIYELPDLAEVSDADSSEPCCPTCGALMHCIAAQHRDNWFSIVNGPHRPGWYDDG